MRPQRQKPAPRRRRKEQHAAESNPTPRYVAAFRTYAWDEGIAELARRFFAAVPSARQVVLVDETRGTVEIPDYEKVSHTAETACPGLPAIPVGRSLWYNVDYGVYALQREFPDVEYFVLSESDLAVNLSLEPMLDFAIEHGIDLIAHQVHRSSPAWFWHPHGLSLSPEPWQSLLFFMLLSRRAILCLVETRRKLAQRFKGGETDIWPFCEAFVPTVLKLDPEMRFADLRKFAATDHLNFRPYICITDPRANRRGSLSHSVLGVERYIESSLRQYPAADFFKSGSALREALRDHVPFERFYLPLHSALAKNRDHAGMRRLRKEANIWKVDRVVDIAFCKPAISSSVSVHSHFQDAEMDASGANGDLSPFEYAFHTRVEPNAWWMVDLLGEHQVEEFLIVNRRIGSDRFSAFYLESSIDGKEWVPQHRQSDPCAVSFDPAMPWRLRFATPFAARYVRVVSLCDGPLHLRRVQILGRILPGHSRLTESAARPWPPGPLTNIAFRKPAIISSVSPYSYSQDVEIEASRANGDLHPYEQAFHTRAEPNPWWMVDLLRKHQVEEVLIVNRRMGSERFSAFYVESSIDGNAWITRLLQSEPCAVSCDPDAPWRLRFATSFMARYVRVIVLGDGPLHLRRIEILGRVLPGHPPLAESARQPWPAGPLTNIAFCKPAIISSVSAYSYSQDVEIEARRANGTLHQYEYAFHTRAEPNAWWMVDLLGEHRVEEVLIVNRHNQSERFSAFYIESSIDGSVWVMRLRQSEPCAVSFDSDAPWRLRFAECFTARYVRLVSLTAGPLHLRRIEFLGRVLPDHLPLAESSGRPWPSAPSTSATICKPAAATPVSAYPDSQDASLHCYDHTFHTPEGQTEQDGSQSYGR